MSVRQDLELLKAVFDQLGPNEQADVMTMIRQLGRLSQLAERYEGVQGALFTLMMSAKVRPEKTQAEFEAVFGTVAP